MKLGRVDKKIVHSVHNHFSVWTKFSMNLKQFKRFVLLSLLSMVYNLIVNVYYISIIYINKYSGQTDNWTITKLNSINIGDIYEA